MALLDVKDVTKNYTLGKTTIKALRGISFSVELGEFLSIVGPSGCGKTTLLNILGCIDKPNSGHVLFNGQNTEHFSDNQEADTRLSEIGFIFQSFNLIPVLNIIENVEFPLILQKIPKKERRERVREIVKEVGLEEYQDHKPDELSGGQRQRVAIARALITRPSIIIADEPTANLDSETSAVILQLMDRLNREEKVTFIFSTHNPEIMSYARRVIHIRDGQIQNIQHKDGGAL